MDAAAEKLRRKLESFHKMLSQCVQPTLKAIDEAESQAARNRKAAQEIEHVAIEQTAAAVEEIKTAQKDEELAIEQLATQVPDSSMRNMLRKRRARIPSVRRNCSSKPGKNRKKRSLCVRRQMQHTR